MNEQQLMTRMNQDHARVMQIYDRYLTEEGFASKYKIEVQVRADVPNNGASAVLEAIARKEIGDHWEFEVVVIGGGPYLAITRLKEST